MRLGFDGWLSLASCAGQLALAMLVAIHGARSALTPPLGLAYVCAFAWNFASLAYDLSGRPGWFFLERASSPFSAPLALHLTAVLTGSVRRTRGVTSLAYLVASALSLSAILAFVLPWAEAFTASRWWAASHLALAAPVLAISIALLVRQRRSTFDAAERSSAELVLAAMVVGGLLVPTELLADLGAPVPRLGHVGTLLASVLMGTVVLRFRLFDCEISPRANLQALGAGVLAIGAYMSVFSLLADNIAMVVWGTATVTLVLVVTLRSFLAVAAANRERTAYLTTLGRFSAQMAHDLKNPLTALKGAVQFLLAAGNEAPRAPREVEFLQLLQVQIERMQVVIDRYQRLSRVHPIRKPTQVNDLLSNVLAMQTIMKPGNITLHTDFAAGLPDCTVDADLLSGAFENVLYNAVDAMPAGGVITIRTARAESLSSAEAVLISVEDSGVGMDARVRERAFDDFYTTKATGSGLGLAFVKRVVEAHGGNADLASTLGRGTSVRLVFPFERGVKDGQ